MSPRTRAALTAATVIALVVLFVALRPTDDTADDTPVAAQETTPPVATAPSGPTGTTATPSPKAPPKPKAPEVTKIDVKALEPVGGVTDLKARKGDTVRFSVSSDQAENIHLHGYDIEKQVAPGSPARFSVKTDIEGIFEVELENSAVLVAELTVNP